MSNYRRRQRWDRFAAWISHTVAMLVLLIVILLIGYLLVVVIPIGWPGQPDVRNSYPAESGNSVLLAFNPDQTRITQVLSDGRVLRFVPQTGLLHSQSQLSQWLDLTSGEGFLIKQLIDQQQQEYLLIAKTDGQILLLMWQSDELTDQHNWPVKFSLAVDASMLHLSADIIQDQLHMAVQLQEHDKATISSYVITAETVDSVASSGQLSPIGSWLLNQPLSSLVLNNNSLLVNTEQGELLRLIPADSAADQDSQPVVEPIELHDVNAGITGIHKLSQNMLLAGTASGELYQLVEPIQANIETNSSMQVAAIYQCGSGSQVKVVVSASKNWFGCIDNQATAKLFYVGRKAPVWRSNKSLPVYDLALTGDQLLLDNGSSMQYLQRDGQPALDSRLLWRPVWYPGYSAPAYVWQPTSTNSGGPKYSVTPLLFGTFKTAILALMFGVPFAVLGAIYTSLILTRKWRERLKPIVEMLEALPTVIIGFLAAVWLAPYLQNHLLIFLLLLFGLPVALVLLGYGWSVYFRRYVPKNWSNWLPLVLIAVLIILMASIGWLLEVWLFGGQLSAWLEQHWGWTYDLRNALVVGVALGLAVTPTIFALCEDALSSVPRHLQLGAMALGSSRWQAVWQVIVPCAASGLLAAVLIGLGRALGETMIVLMAASNTPLIEASPLRGLQAIAPALAIEMPKADPGGVHYRVLMLCALVLFVFTLLANTLAEFIRERLRSRYQL